MVYYKLLLMDILELFQFIPFTNSAVLNIIHIFIHFNEIFLIKCLDQWINTFSVVYESTCLS